MARHRRRVWYILLLTVFFTVGGIVSLINTPGPLWILLPAIAIVFSASLTVVQVMSIMAVNREDELTRNRPDSK